MFIRGLAGSWIAAVTIGVAALIGVTPASAVTISPGTVLPDAVSYEYFGLNFADNIKTSNTVGTLVYTGQPGCGGTCEATTALGASPSVSATVNEVVYQYTSGGGVAASLGYYVAYLNAPGTYPVTLHAIDSISAPDGTAISTHLKIGKASTNMSSFSNFLTTEFEEAHCVNGCPSPGFIVPSAPFVADNVIQVDANTLYYIQLDILMRPQPTNVQVSAMIDPTFTASASGGTFVFSPGVSSTAAVPEPAMWEIMIVGFGMVGGALRQRRMKPLRIAA